MAIGQMRKSSQEVAEVGVRLNAPESAVFDEGVEDGSVLHTTGISNKKPNLFSYGDRTDGIFDGVFIDAYLAVFQIDAERPSLAKGISDAPASTDR